MIEFKSISKQYHDELALNDINLTVQSHEFFVMVGPSGSGKTTLLKMVNRLVVPSSGAVLIDGENVADMDLQNLRRHMGYVLQSSALFPNMTVMQNAAVQLEALGWGKVDIKTRINDLLTLVDLDPEIYAERKPSELSGGEAQRVGIVRALAADPNLILMDEPFSALDPVSKGQLQHLIGRIHEKLKTTIIMVTHDMQEAFRLAERVAVIHDGNLEQVGTPSEIIKHPANDFVKDFFKYMRGTQPTLKQMISSGFAQNAKADLPLKLSLDSSIYDLSEFFKQDEHALVQVENYQISLPDLVAFLATLGNGGNQDAE